MIIHEQDGFGHIEILIVVVVIGLIAGAGVLIAQRNKKTTADSITSKTSQSSNTKKTPTTSDSKVTTLAPKSTFVTTPSSASTPTNKPTTGSSASTPTSSSTTTTTAPTPTVTPLSALTTIITNLNNNTAQAAQVTSTSVDVAGPIGTAHARPIVFSVNGTVYFAYTQGTKPKFSQTAAQTAGSMAITTGSLSGLSLLQAHIDKSGNLVDENFVAVGFSTGGN